MKTKDGTAQTVPSDQIYLHEYLIASLLKSIKLMSASEAIDVRSTSLTVNRNMIAILTDTGTGGTFLNWTIHYLRGDKTHYNAVLDQELELCVNPLQSSNAHGFRANQPMTLNDFTKVFARLQQHPQHSSIYFHNFFSRDYWDRSETTQAIDLLDPCVAHKIVVTLPVHMHLYYCGHKHRGGGVWSRTGDRYITDSNEAHSDVVDYYFSDSKEIWQQQQLTNVWDEREFIALNFDPFTRHRSIADCFGSDMQRYDISAMDLWTTFDQSVFDLFAYLNTPIDQERYHAWLPIYTEWKKLHRQRLMFAWYYDTIVHNILHGIDYDLIRFNLDLRQEGAIQHALIYHHNLNLKTWQLEKFTNTQQLHQLLEPNIHDLTKSRIKDSDPASL